MKLTRKAIESICTELRNLVREENRIEEIILTKMKTIADQHIYEQMGYSSLFDFLVKDSGMKPATAYRRTQALRLTERSPVALRMMTEGKLSLSNAASIEQAVRTERKLELQSGAPQKEIEQELGSRLEGILKLSQGKSYRECQRILAQELPLQAEQKLRQAVSTPTPEGKIQLVMNITPELQAKIDELKNLLSHIDPHPTPEAFLEIVTEKLLKQLRKNKPYALPTSEVNERSASGADLASLPVRQLYSRHVRTDHERHIWARAGGRCEFVSALNGKRCEAQHLLEIEHIRPRALGGTNELENLMLLCRTHNRYHAWREGLSRRDIS